MYEEQWWLIERQQSFGPEGFFEGPGWSKSALRAIRFPTKESAQDFLDHYVRGATALGSPDTMRGFAYPVAHAWVSAPVLDKRVAMLRDALEVEDGFVVRLQQAITSYLMPGGDSEKEVLDRIIEMLDGPMQREVQDKTRAALAATEFTERFTSVGVSIRLFAAGKQDWFTCSDGWLHELLSSDGGPTTSTWKMTCPLCGWSTRGNSVDALSHQEAAHKLKVHGSVTARPKGGR